MTYPRFVVGLQSLYKNGNPNVTLEKLKQMKADGKITEDEFVFIIGEVTE